MGKRPSLLRYFWSELKWAVSTSRNWLRLLFRHRRLAITRLREGLKSEEFRKRTHGWSRTTTFVYGQARVSAPVIVGLATAVYCGFTQNSVLMSLAYGLSASIITHFALLALPFAILASVPVLAFFFIRALLPANIPEPPAEDQSVVVAAEQQGGTTHGPEDGASAASSEGQVNGGTAEAQRQDPQGGSSAAPPKASDPLSPENQVAGNEAMLAQFDGSDRPLVLRILHSDGAVVVTDPRDLAKISRWIDVVREERQAMAAREKEIDELLDLSTYIGHRALFELGLLDRASFDPVPPAFEMATEGERLAAVEERTRDRELEFAAANSHQSRAIGDTYLDPTDTDPKPTGGQTRFVNPRGPGFVIGTLADLKRMAAPRLLSPVGRMIVTTYVRATNDREMMKRWVLIDRTAPNERTVFLRAGVPITIDLRHYEDLILTGEIKDTVAQELARYYATVKQAAKETTDYLSQLQPVARLVKLVLDEAHNRMRQETAEAQTAEAATPETEESPYAHLLTKEEEEFRNDMLWERREQLKLLILESVPRKPLDR